VKDSTESRAISTVSSVDDTPRWRANRHIGSLVVTVVSQRAWLLRMLLDGAADKRGRSGLLHTAIVVFAAYIIYIISYTSQSFHFLSFHLIYLFSA